MESMEEKYICETCGKEYNVLNKVAHQIFCSNKERYRSFSSIKSKNQINNGKNNEDINIKILNRQKIKSRDQKANIHTLFDDENKIEKKEPKINNLNLININKPKIMKKINDERLQNIFNIKDNEHLNKNNLKIKIKLRKAENKEITLQKNNNINIQITPNKMNNFNFQPIKNNNFSISNNNIIINNENNINEIHNYNKISFPSNNNLLINSNNNKNDDIIKKDEELALKLMKEELKEIEENEIREKEKKEREDLKINELEIKRLLENDLKEIEQQESKKKNEERMRQIEEQIKKKKEEKERKIKEELRRINEEIRKKMEETRRRNEEVIRILRDNMERRNRILEESLRRMNISHGNNLNNYSNLIESKIIVSKLNEENKKCVICYEDFVDNDNAIYLPCFHVFHSKCIKEWLNTKDICPLCKINVKNNLNNNI